MTYRPKPAPGRRVYHRNWRTGYFVNSARGTARAVSRRYTWIDNDFHLSSDYLWFNLHGNPEKFWGISGKVERHTARYLSSLRKTKGGHEYHLRTGGEALKDNAARRLNTEIEVKDVSAIGSEQRAKAFLRLARAARSAYGADWRMKTTVKVLTDLSGGLPFALAICKEAHAAGFQTMILARGSAVRETFAGHTEVTYVRGSKVIR